MIVSDLIESGALDRGREGYSTTRTFIVDGVVGDAVNKLYNATVLGGIPQYGDPHPSIPDIQVTNVNATPINGNQIRVLVKYSAPNPEDIAESEAEVDESGGTVILSSVSSTETVFRDIEGTLLTADYNRFNEIGDPLSGYERTTYFGTADIEVPQLRAQFTRTETSIPKATITRYLSKVNSVAWSGYPPKTWLCSSITARENKGKFDVEYVFNYRADTWRLEVTAQIPQSILVDFPIDVDEGNGFARYDVYQSEDFNALGLSF